MLLGEVRQPDTLNTGTTSSTESTIAYGAYSQINDGTVLDAVASPTTTQGASSSVVGTSSPGVVAPILGEVVMDSTSTSSMVTGTAWVTPSVTLAGNDGSRYEGTPPGDPPNPMATTRADLQCSQKRATASKFRRQAPGDPSCDPDGPPPDASGSPPGGPHPHESPSGGPPYTPSESPCSTSGATGTNTSPAASTSSPAPSNKFQSLPPLLQWYQCAVVTIFAVAGCIYLARRKKERSRQEYCCHADSPGAFDGCGRTCGSKDSWLLAMFRLLRREKSPRCRQMILPPRCSCARIDGCVDVLNERGTTERV